MPVEPHNAFIHFTLSLKYVTLYISVVPRGKV
jgi:hypothetical protein